jgi:hypothetical protein
MPCLTGTAAPSPQTSLRRSAQAICEGARLSAFHRGSRQRDFRRQRLSARPGFLGRGEQVWPVRRAGVTRPDLSQSSDSTSRAGRSAGRLMPDAARERVANPPAGTALARAIWECLPGRVRKGRGSALYVTETGTNVNRSVTVIFPSPLVGEGGEWRAPRATRAG